MPKNDPLSDRYTIVTGNMSDTLAIVLPNNLYIFGSTTNHLPFSCKVGCPHHHHHHLCIYGPTINTNYAHYLIRPFIFLRGAQSGNLSKATMGLSTPVTQARSLHSTGSRCWNRASRASGQASASRSSRTSILTHLDKHIAFK